MKTILIHHHLGLGEDISSLNKLLKSNTIIKKYSYASYLFTKESKQFLKKCYDIGKATEKHNVSDENILNILLAEIENYDDIGYNYLPNYYAYPDYINEKINSEHIKNYTDYGCPLNFCILNGCKNTNKAKNYSTLIKETKEKFNAVYKKYPIIY